MGEIPELNIVMTFSDEPSARAGVNAVSGVLGSLPSVRNYDAKAEIPMISGRKATVAVLIAAAADFNTAANAAETMAHIYQNLTRNAVVQQMPGLEKIEPDGCSVDQPGSNIVALPTVIYRPAESS